jgi:hypothetical protein
MEPIYGVLIVAVPIVGLWLAANYADVGHFWRAMRRQKRINRQAIARRLRDLMP